MNREDIIRMAREAGASQAETRMNPGRPAHSFSMTHLERFAALVAAAEREACAEICQQQSRLQLDERVMRGIDICENAIRARGQA